MLAVTLAVTGRCGALFTLCERLLLQTRRMAKGHHPQSWYGLGRCQNGLGGTTTRVFCWVISCGRATTWGNKTKSSRNLVGAPSGRSTLEPPSSRWTNCGQIERVISEKFERSIHGMNVCQYSLARPIPAVVGPEMNQCNAFPHSSISCLHIGPTLAQCSYLCWLMVIVPTLQKLWRTRIHELGIPFSTRIQPMQTHMNYRLSTPIAVPILLVIFPECHPSDISSCLRSWSVHLPVALRVGSAPRLGTESFRQVRWRCNLWDKGVTITSSFSFFAVNLWKATIFHGKTGKDKIFPQKNPLIINQFPMFGGQIHHVWIPTGSRWSGLSRGCWGIVSSKAVRWPRDPAGIPGIPGAPGVSKALG